MHQQLFLKRQLQVVKKRLFSSQLNSSKELGIYQKLEKELEPSILKVQDISGGCGSMYSIEIHSKKFNGLSLIKQHRMVTDLLKQDISQMHGLLIKTFTVKNV